MGGAPPAGRRRPRSRGSCRARLLLAAILPAAAAAAADMVRNPDFTEQANGFPADWRDTQRIQQVSLDRHDKPPGRQASLRVEVTKEVNGRHGEIAQTIPVKPNTAYRLSGWLRSTRDGLAFYQVKRIQHGRELERIDSARSGLEWKRVSLTFDSGEAEAIQLLCRWNQGAKDTGHRAWFAAPELDDAAKFPAEGLHEPLAVATFESIGLYWKPAEGGPGNTCRVHYRPAESADWRAGQPLWFDPNEHQDLPQHSREYRGSLVHLKAGTQYQVRLTLEQGATERLLTVSTWDETPPIRNTVALPERWEETLEITAGGSARDGYVVYAPAPGKQSLGDAGGRHEVNIRVRAPFVILRGLTLRNAAAHGIELLDVHHVIVEDCEVSGWGRVENDGFGVNGDAAVFGNSPALSHIVVQRCDLHHPRSHSNSWNEPRTRPDGSRSAHPMGPQGITLRKGLGSYVVRHNRIHSDIDHMFNDGMGEFANFSFAGFPNRDSDIYGNFVSHCRDDGLEIEGANMNVRVWLNCTDACMMSLAAAATSLGPACFWRNIALRSRTGPTADWDGTKGGGFLKLGNESSRWTGGRIFVYHNTVYQPEPWPGASDPSGCRSGLIWTSPVKRQRNVISRNNILHCRRDSDAAIRDPLMSPDNDLDYDLLHGTVTAREGSEPHGVHAIPAYEPSHGTPPPLRAGTPGHDGGCRLPGFNDDFAGGAPDLGAIEAGNGCPIPSTWPRFPRLAPAAKEGDGR